MFVVFMFKGRFVLGFCTGVPRPDVDVFVPFVLASGVLVDVAVAVAVAPVVTAPVEALEAVGIVG